MNKSKTINKIYFDEVSGSVDDWLTTYLNFDSVNVTVKPSNGSLFLDVYYKGRGSYMRGKMHVSTQLNYSWRIFFIGSKALFEGVQEYKNVSVSIEKTLFNKRKITIHFNERKAKDVVLYGSKVVLMQLVTEDVVSDNTAVLQPHEHKPKIAHDKLDLHRISMLVFEAVLVSLISYIVHRFVHDELTILQAVSLYGFIGLLAYVNDFAKNIEQVIGLLLAIAFFSNLPYGGFAVAMICIYFFFFRTEVKTTKATTNILLNPKAKETLLVFLRKIGQIPPEKHA